MSINALGVVVAMVISIGSVTWAGSNILSEKIDGVVLAASQASQEFIRYEELIEEAQEEQRMLKSLPPELRSPVHNIHIEQLDNRIKKYERRQKRLD